MNIVLLEPEIPANTGNIGRTCVATGTKLHLIEPLGFDISDKAVRRAGMDYWKDLDLAVYKNFEEFLEKNPGAKIYMATTKAETPAIIAISFLLDIIVCSAMVCVRMCIYDCFYCYILLGKILCNFGKNSFSIFSIASRINHV